MASSYNRYRRSSSLSNRLGNRNSDSDLGNKRYESSNYHHHTYQQSHNSRINSSFQSGNKYSSESNRRSSSYDKNESHRSSSPKYRIDYDRDEQAIINSRKFDDPPYSRCFILCSKDTTENELDHAFQKFGRIQDIWIVRDHQTKIGKGIAYIKYSKASEAAKAVEEMSGKYLNDRHQRPVKVFISGCKHQIDRNQPNGELYDRMLRLFVVVNKKFTKFDLRNTFKKYGTITNCHILQDNDTKESKGIGYVTFSKASEAARAMEECSKSFNAKFAKLSNSIQTNDIKTRGSFLFSSTSSLNKKPNYKHESSLNDDDLSSSNNESLHGNECMDDDVEILTKKKLALENVCIQIENNKSKNNNLITSSLNNDAASLLAAAAGVSSPTIASITSSGNTKIDAMSAGSVLKFNDLAMLANNCSNTVDSSQKPDRKILIIDDKNSKQIKVKLSQTEHGHIVLSKNSSPSLIGSSPLLNVTQPVNKSPILLVKSKVNESFLRQLFDLVPGLVEFGCYATGCFQISNQYVVRYENEILSAYVVKKFNELILPSGDKICVEYLNEEFLRNFFLLNTTLSSKITNLSPVITNNNNNFSQPISSNTSNASSTPTTASLLNATIHSPSLYSNALLNNASLNEFDKSSFLNKTTSSNNNRHLPSSISLLNSIFNNNRNESIGLKNSDESNNNHTDLNSNNTNSIENNKNNGCFNNIINNNHSNLKTDIDYSSYLNNKATVVLISCRDEITKDLLHLIMSQFNNLIDVHLNDDKCSGYANFSNEIDALLAVNTINERDLANNHFKARIEKKTSNTFNSLLSNSNDHKNNHSTHNDDNNESKISIKRQNSALSNDKNNNDKNNTDETDSIINYNKNAAKSSHNDIHNMSYSKMVNARSHDDDLDTHDKRKKLCVKNF